MTVDSIDYEYEVMCLIARLRERDDDPTYADAPCYDTYARISKKNTGNDEDKTIRQTFHLLSDLVRLPARLGEVLVDDARSAWKRDGKRPGFNRLLERLNKRESSGVLVRFADRLARQPWDIEQVIRVGEHSAYRVITQWDEFDLSMWRDVERLRAEVAAAQRESRIKSERILNKVNDRLAVGDDRNGPSPFGHRWPGEEHISDEQLAVERKAICDGYTLVLDRGSWGDVARLWNERGLTTRNGVAWNSLNVRQCLTLPRHGGYVRRGNKIVGHLPQNAVVDRSVFDAFTRLLDGRKPGRQPAQTIVLDEQRVASPHFLSSAVRCDRCEMGMVGSMAEGRYEDGERKRIYRCPPKGCKGNSVDARAAERWAGIEVIRVLAAPEHAAMLSRKRAALVEIGDRIREYEQAIGRLVERANGVHVSRREAYDERIANLEAELSPLLDERARLREMAHAASTPADVDQLCREWNEGTPAQRRRLVMLAFPRGFFCAPVGRSARIRGEDILSRFSAVRGKACPKRTDI